MQLHYFHFSIIEVKHNCDIFKSFFYLLNIWSGVCVWGSHLFLLPTSASASLIRSGRYRRLPPCITQRNYVNRLDTRNVREINGTVKREEVVDIFREKKVELLALTEKELKGNGEVSWCGVGIITGVQEMERAREGVASLSNDVWHSTVVELRCVSFRILWIKFKFLKVKVCVVVGYGPK